MRELIIRSIQKIIVGFITCGMLLITLNHGSLAIYERRTMFIMIGLIIGIKVIKAIKGE